MIIYRCRDKRLDLVTQSETDYKYIYIFHMPPLKWYNLHCVEN